MISVTAWIRAARSRLRADQSQPLMKRSDRVWNDVGSRTVSVGLMPTASKANAGDKGNPDFDPKSPGLDDTESAQDVTENAMR